MRQQLQKSKINKEKLLNNFFDGPPKINLGPSFFLNKLGGHILKVRQSLNKLIMHNIAEFSEFRKGGGFTPSPIYPRDNYESNIYFP